MEDGRRGLRARAHRGVGAHHGCEGGQDRLSQHDEPLGQLPAFDGRICINVRLALYPPECLEYVVVHELCHLLERGHGPRFHALMDTFMPDWKERRAKLR